MLAARGLREDDDGRLGRIEGEYLVAVRRQAAGVALKAGLAAAALLLLSWLLIPGA